MAVKNCQCFINKGNKGTKESFTKSIFFSLQIVPFRLGKLLGKVGPNFLSFLYLSQLKNITNMGIQMKDATFLSNSIIS